MFSSIFVLSRHYNINTIDFFTAEWNIVNPPIVFGQTARLSCLVEFKTSNYSTPTWTGGPNYSTISFHGSTADKKKYRVTIIHGDDQFESVLEIFDFGESDVNCDYSCSFGFHENRKMLGLTEKHFVCKCLYITSVLFL